MSSLLIHNIGQLVTLSGPARPRVGSELAELGTLMNGALLWRDGRIVASGEYDSVVWQGDGVETLDAEGRVVTPGLIDAHTHPVFGGNRVEEYEMRARGATYEEIAASGGGIERTMEATRAASEDELVEVGKKYAGWFLQGGTTTVEAKSGYGLSTEDELKILRAMRRLGSETPLRYIPTFLGAHAFPPECGADREAYISEVIEEMLPAVAAENLAEFCDAFCERNYCTLGMTRKVFEAAKSLGFGLRLHADQLTCGGGAQLAAEMGAKTADHLEQTDQAGIQALAEAGVQPVLLPASVYALGLKKYPDARAMIAAGLAVVLATDFNPGSSPTPSLPIAMSLACTQMKMTPAEALSACTINAAYSLNRGHELGSLDPGKIADVVLWNCDDYREIPYFFGVNHAAQVFTAGKKVKR